MSETSVRHPFFEEADKAGHGQWISEHYGLLWNWVQYHVKEALLEKQKVIDELGGGANKTLFSAERFA